MKLQAIRTNCHTGVATAVEVEAEIVLGYDGKRWLFLSGGPTGYESMPANRIAEAIAKSHSWTACAGTKPVGMAAGLDKLVVPLDQLRRLLPLL